MSAWRPQFLARCISRWASWCAIWHRLDPARPVIVHCKSGVRSAAACQLLRQMGFREVYNLRGGIDAWG
jgi:rhodanese-related sulfurtransferase